MKSTDQHTAPRKQPTQLRARLTVDCILQAAESIITKKGYEYATTNHIAEVAGVSIGTVYQYFPRKEAIVAALVENAVVGSSAPVRQQLLASMHEPLTQCLPVIIGLLLKTRKQNGMILRQLVRDVVAIGSDSEQLTPETFLYSTFRLFYVEHRDEIKIENLDMAMSVCEFMIIGGINSYLDDPAPKLADEEFVEQLSNAVNKYLTT
ncbi:MAG: TetR/AcrR family transcriptional regulator [Proteobacteria bacterium]|nr:TetR/AcrR family transcriptional regulator [Pseudomonadota bacterium]